MPTLEITTDELFQLTDQLDFESKKKLFERIKPEIISAKWSQLLARIDATTGAEPISEQEIEEEVERAREDFVANRR